MRGVIALGIKGRRKSEDMGWTELDTEAAALAALHSDGNKTLGHIGPS
jgi:hypothetical protein